MNVSDTPQETAVAAGLDRRFYAFAIDRLLAWGGYAVTGWGAYALSGSVPAAVLTVAGAVVLVSLVWVMMVGLAGITPGKAALGLRVVDRGTGGPIGFGHAFVRQLVLGVAALPVFGLGVAMLAWTAVMDSSGLRRGWHDQVSGSAVVDIRPPKVVDSEAPPPPRRIVNLTAMRLMPVPPTPTGTAVGATGTPVGGPAPAARQVLHQPVPMGVPATPVLEPEPAPQPAPRLAPQAAPSPVADPFAQPFAPQPAVPQAPVAQAAPSPVVEPAAPVAPAPPEAPQPLSRPHAPADPQPAAPAVAPQSPPTQEVPPVRSEPPAASHAAAHAQPIVAMPGTAQWRVSFDTGESFVVAGLALVGRKPEPRPGEAVAHLVALPSHDMSLSKTHAQFQVVPDGALVVMDRGSTNGSVLIRAGVSRPLGARKPATLREGDRVRFGDREMTVARA